MYQMAESIFITPSSLTDALEFDPARTLYDMLSDSGIQAMLHIEFDMGCNFDEILHPGASRKGEYIRPPPPSVIGEHFVLNIETKHGLPVRSIEGCVS
jgi:hypothetical protein